MSGDDVEIRVRVRDEASAALAGIQGRLGMFAAIGSFGSLAGLPAILISIANAALVVPGAISVAAAALATFDVATAGVGEALGLMGKKTAGGSAAVQSSGRAIRDAVDGINNAKTRQAQVAEDTARAISRAERDVSRAAQEAARDVSKAKQEQARTERDVADQIESALEQQQKATEDLDGARVQAARTLDDLRDRVKDYANDEEGARLRVLAAYSAQRKVNADVTSTNLEKLQAAQSVRDAEERLADTQKSRTADTAKLAAEEAKGVEGSDQVVAAKARLQEATEAVVKAREDGAEREADAAQRVADAEQSGAERVASAKEALADTERNAARQRAEAADSVTDAERRLSDAQQDAAKSAAGAAGGANSYAAALAKLSPNARAFVEAIKSVRPAWQDMQKAVQDKFFEGFAAKVKDLSGTYLPVLRAGMTGIAAAMNKMALYAGDALMKPAVVAAVNNILGNTKKLFDNAGTALGDFVEGFLKLASIGSDYLPAVGTWLSNIARDFKDWVTANPDKIRQFIDDGLRTLGDLRDVIVEVVRLFRNLFVGSADGRTFLQLLRDVIGFLADNAGVVRAVLYAIGAAWVVSKVAGFASAVSGVIGLVGTLAARIRGLPRLPAVGRALGTAAAVAAPVAVAYGVSKAASGRFADDPTAKSQSGGESMQQGAAGFASLVESLGSLGTGDTGPIVKWWKDQMTILNQDIAGIGDSPLGQFITNLGLQWQEAWTAISNFFSGIPVWWQDSVWGPISTTVSDWWTNNVQIPIENGIKWVVDTWNGIPAWWQGVWDSIATAVSNWWLLNVQIPIDNGIKWVVDTWNGIPGWWSNLWATIARVVSDWWTVNISNPVNDALGWVKWKWDEFLFWIQGIAYRINRSLADMWGGIKGGARDAVNGAIGLLNGLITGVNRAIAGLNSINPFGAIGMVPYIPYLAKGGIASGMAIVGERGPELVNLGAGARVNTAGDTRRMLGQGGGAGPVEVVLRIDGGNDALSSLLMRMQRTGELQLLPAS